MFSSVATKPDRFERPRRFARFAHPPKPGPLPFKSISKETELDEFGLLRTVYGQHPRYSRYLAAAFLDMLQLPKTIQPLLLFGPSEGTFPELVTGGWFVTRGYSYQTYTAHSFTFQSRFSDIDRVHGSTPVDFVAYLTQKRVIGIDVDSIYHASNNPFGGAAKVGYDAQRRIRLQSGTTLSNVISVNEESTGFCLENGPDELVVLDLARIEAA